MDSEQREAVISGISGMFPECDSMEEFKDKLFSKSVLIKPDESAHAYTWDSDIFWRGHCREVYRFDRDYFGIPPRFLKCCDPVIGILLEKTLEAFLDAGINPNSMSGHNVGVFAAPSQSDLESVEIVSSDKGKVFFAYMVGQSRAMIANRISFSFKFTGPSYSMEASWVAAIQALDKAASMVSSGIVEAAVVVSAGILYSTILDEQMREMGILTSDGLCQPFDAEAHGFVRSEAAVVFIIQRRKDAKRIYGTVKKTQTMMVGAKCCGFVKIDPSIETFLTNFYDVIHENPEDVSYIEANGLSSKDSDAKELNALASVFCSHKKTPQLIGSVTGNVGLTDACTGLVAMVKAILALETGVIPPTVNYRTPNPEVPALLSGKLKPVTESMDLPGDLVAVNTFSLTGAVSHTLLKRHDKVKRSLTGQELPEDGLPRLVLLQARHEQGARAVCDKVSSMVVDVEFVSLVNDAFKTPISNNYLWRGYTIIPSPQNHPVSNIKKFDGNRRPLWLVFSGMGSQWAGMGKDLLKIPLFLSTIEKCNQLLRPKGIDLFHILTTDDACIFDNILNCMVGITATQIGLVDILKELNITPDGIIGHSVGELGCAYADGCLTAEQTILVSYSRGKASIDSLDNDYIKGSMAAVGLSRDNIKRFVPATIDVACHNSNESCTLSGPTEDIVSFVEFLKSKGVFARAVSAGGIAYHSRYIRDVAPKLMESLKQLIPEPKPRSSKWICTSVPESQWDTQDAKFCSPEYHTNNLLNPVYFQEGFQHVPSNAIILEIAPHGLLQAILRRAASPKAVNLALTNRAAKSNLGHLLKCLGELHLNGVIFDVNAFYPKVEYPVSRGTPSLSTLATWERDLIHYTESRKELAKISCRNRFTMTMNVSPNVPDYLLWAEHRIGGLPVLPISQILMYPWRSILSWRDQDLDRHYTIIEDFKIRGTVLVHKTEFKLQSLFSPATYSFEVCLEKEGKKHCPIILTGKLVDPSDDEPKPIKVSCGKEDPSSMEIISQKETYLILSELGCDLGPQFQLIKKLQLGLKESVAIVEWNANWITFLDSLIKIAVVFESLGHGTLMDVKSIQRLTVDGRLLSSLPLGTELEVLYQSWCHRLVCQGVELNGVALGPLTASDTAPLAWAESRFQPYFVDDLTTEAFWSCSLETASEDLFRSWRDEPCVVNILDLSLDYSSPSLIAKMLEKNFPNWRPFELKISVVDVEGARQQVGEMHGKAVVVVGEQSAVASLLSLCHDADHLYCLKISVVDVEGARQQVGEMHGKAVVVVGEQSAVASLLSLCHDTDHLYCVSHINKGAPQLNRDLKPVYTCQTKSGGKLVFYKKVYNKMDFCVYKSDSLDWLSGLKNFVKTKEGSFQTIVLVTNKLMPRQVLIALSNEPFANQIRTVFIRDDDAPPFSLSTSLYSSQLALGLSVNILWGGSWGSLRTLSLLVGPVTPCTVNANNLVSSSIKDLRVNCIGLNTRYITFKQKPYIKEPELSCVDYSGTLRDQRVMGVAYLQPESSSVLPDSVLQWPVPAGWTLEDAATVPVIYTLALYCVKYVADLEKGETVLVHAGMSLIGQAVISVALDAGARIIASVVDQQEASQLLNLFSGVKDSDVFILGKENITFSIKQRTRRNGVDVIFDCLGGRDFQDTLKTVNMYGRIIYFSEIENDKWEKIGLGTFIKDVSFSGISLDSIKMSSDECRTKIKEAVENGIIKGVVKPLAKRIFRLSELSDALRYLKTNNITVKTVLTSTNGSETKRPAGYKESKFGSLQIIVGENDKLNLTLAEQLIREGESQIMLLINEEYKISYVMKKINYILQREKSLLITNSPSCLDSVESTSRFLEGCLHVGEVSSIFCICMDENGSRMKNLDSASRRVLPGLQQFVSLLSRGTAVCDSRASSGLPVCSIRGEASTDAAKVVPYLPGFLANTTTSDTIYYVADSCGRNKIKDEVDPLSFLPGKVEELFLLGEYKEFHPRFVEQTTLSPPYSAVKRNVLPLFVIPGLGELSIQPLLRRLMYPTFCCRLPVEIPPVQELAEILVQNIVNIQEQGPYNVVGESWGGALALSVARLLEVYGHEVNLILVQGVPATAQATLRSLCGRFGAADPGTCIINAALNTPSEVVKHVVWRERLSELLLTLEPDLREPVSRAVVKHAVWRERLSELLLTLEPDMREPVSRAVTALNNQLSLLLNFKYSNQLFSGNVILISSKCGLSNALQNIYTYCQRPHQVVTVDVTDHRLLLANDVTITAINGNMACFH